MSAGRAEARGGRLLRRCVQHRDVRGVLACRGGRWTVDNESEIRMLAALGADGEGALDRFGALAETLNAGLVDASGLRRLNARLTEIAAAPEERLAIEWCDPDVMAQAAFACVCLPPASHRNAPRWLAWALSARLEDNIVRGGFPGPGWLTLRSRNRHWGWGFDRDTCWIARLPAEFWTRLKSHPCGWLRDAASASDPRTTPRTLRHLARSHQAEVSDLVASHPSTPAAVLRHHATNSASWEVRLRVAQNRSTPPRLLGLLAKDVLSNVRTAVAEHPSTPVAVVEALADDDSPHVRAKVARRGDLGQRDLNRLARDCDDGVRCTVALNPSASGFVVSALSTDRIAAVRAAAASSGRLLPHQYCSLAKDRATTVRRSVAYVAAGRLGIDAKGLLAALAHDPKMDVRVAAACNEGASPATLETLAADRQSRVRNAAALNPSTPQESLRALARDNSRWVRRWVAHNPSAPADLLAQLLESATSDIRSAVAANPAAAAETLRRLAADDDFCARHGLAQNPTAPQEALERLASLGGCWMRESVARNPAAPPRTLAKLAADQDRRVRTAAANSLHQRSRAQIAAAIAAARNSTDWPSTCLEAIRSAIRRLRERCRNPTKLRQAAAPLTGMTSRT